MTNEYKSGLESSGKCAHDKELAKCPTCFVFAKQQQDAVNDQRIIVAKMSVESCVELFKIKHTYQSKSELARVLECSEQDAEETLYARIESLLAQIVETTGENMESLYWQLDARSRE